MQDIDMTEKELFDKFTFHKEGGKGDDDIYVTERKTGSRVRICANMTNAEKFLRENKWAMIERFKVFWFKEL